MTTPLSTRRRLSASLGTMMQLILAFGLFMGRQTESSSSRARRRCGRIAWLPGPLRLRIRERQADAGTRPWAPELVRRAIGDENYQAIRHVGLVYDDWTGTRLDDSNRRECDDALDLLATQTGLKVIIMRGSQATGRRLTSLRGAFHVCLWRSTLTEAWVGTRMDEDLMDRSDSPWDSPLRRTSHADNPRAWRRDLPSRVIRAALRPRGDRGGNPGRIRQVAQPGRMTFRDRFKVERVPNLLVIPEQTDGRLTLIRMAGTLATRHDHRQNSGANRLGQMRPCIDHGGEARFGLTSVGGQMMGDRPKWKTQVI